MHTNHVDFFQKFVDEYTEYYQDGKIPTTADQDVKYALQLQQERLKKKGYSMQYEMSPRGHLADGGGIDVHWHDEIYDNCQKCRTYLTTKTIYKDGKRIYRKKQNEVFYEIITNTINEQPLADELYVCPNCGCIVKIKELEEGCPYCKTHFKMDELFPKVSSFFHTRDYSGTGNEVKIQVLKFIIPFVLLFGIGSFVVQFMNQESVVKSVLSSIFFGAFVGVPTGYMLWAFTFMGIVFFDAFRSLPAFFNMLGSRKKFTTHMRHYSPAFSYDYLSNKVNSYIKTMIFSEKENQLPFYNGEPLDDSLENILEATMFGNPGIKDFYISGNYAYLRLKVYMDNIYATDHGIDHKREKFYLDMYRNIAKPIDYNFSIHKITCKACGSSFDASKHTNCPYCGTHYPIEDDDWMITSFKRI